MMITEFLSGTAADRLIGPILLLDAQGAILDANAAATELYGYPREEMLTMSVAALRTSSSDMCGGTTAGSDTGDTLIAETQVRSGGTTFPAEVRTAVVESHGQRLVLRFVHDTSARSEEEAALRQSDAKHAAMIANISDVIGIMGVDGCMLYKSPNIEKWFGWQPDDLVGTDGWLTVHPDDRERLQGEFFRILQADGAVTTVEYQYLCKGGHYKWIELTATNLVTDPRIAGVLLNYRDISERKQMERLGRELNSVIDLIGTVSEMRDPYTAGHQRRVAELAVAIGTEMGIESSGVDDLRVAGLIHDIGKMSVPAELLSKPSALSPAEFMLIKGHAEAGFSILTSARMPHAIADLVHMHHERCDGSGYPQGLVGADLSVGAKVLMVADVVEAMSSHRPYRAALGTEAALREIERGSGTLYDPEVSAYCVKVVQGAGFEFSVHG